MALVWCVNMFALAVVLCMNAHTTMAQQFMCNTTHAGIDFADANFSIVSGQTPGDCCNACWTHNTNRSAADPVCTTAVWYRRAMVCGLKATANTPVKGNQVEASFPLVSNYNFGFASVYTANMVLQAAPAKAKVWGFCSDGDDVTVTFGANKISATITTKIVAGVGRVTLWSVLLPATPATDISNNPHTITASNGSKLETIDNVLFGDVWVCSGQSNMAYSINGSNGQGLVHPPVNNSLGEEVNMKLAMFKRIRLFHVGRAESSTPQLQVAPNGDGGSHIPVIQGWSEPCPNGICRVDFSNICWFYGRDTFVAHNMTTPIGLIGSYVGGTRDELWSSPDALSKCYPANTTYAINETKDEDLDIGSGGGFSTLWFGMITPLLNSTIKGAIWYQGEANSHQPGGATGGYNCTFPAMIDDWRQKWLEGTDQQTETEFPFGFVQLNSVGNATTYDNPTDPGDPFSPMFGFAGLRWSQTAGYGYVPNPRMKKVFMATSYDTPDRPFPFTGINGVFDQGFNVHSPYKQPTASRLAREGFALITGRQIDTSPLAESVSRSGSTVVLTIKSAGQGIFLRTSVGFEALVPGRANATGTWMSVAVTSHTFDTATITNVATTATKIRYNWYSNPCGKYCYGCAVYVGVAPFTTLSGGENFLPLPPFVMDLQ